MHCSLWVHSLGLLGVQLCHRSSGHCGLGAALLNPCHAMPSPVLGAEHQQGSSCTRSTAGCSLGRWLLFSRICQIIHVLSQHDVGGLLLLGCPSEPGYGLGSHSSAVLTRCLVHSQPCCSNPMVLFLPGTCIAGGRSVCLLIYTNFFPPQRRGTFLGRCVEWELHLGCGAMRGCHLFPGNSPTPGLVVH